MAIGPNVPILKRRGTPAALRAIVAAHVLAIIAGTAIVFALSPRFGVPGAVTGLGAATVVRETVLALAVRMTAPAEGSGDDEEDDEDDAEEDG